MSIKAVISAAGYGSRFFPITKVINKSMLPVLNRPIIDYIVDDCLVAGVNEIAIICLPGDNQILEYYTEDKVLLNYFCQRGWEQKYASLAGLHQKADITILRQPVDGRYGTAIPPLIAEAFIGASDFYLLAGDDVVLRKQHDSVLAEMIHERDKHGADAVIAAIRINPNDASRYGILITQEEEGNLWLRGLVEKPDPQKAPSNLASISRFLVPAIFLEDVKEVQPDARTGEYLIIDALVQYAKSNRVLVHTIDSGYFDCGNIEGWLGVNNTAASFSEK